MFIENAPGRRNALPPPPHCSLDIRVKLHIKMNAPARAGGGEGVVLSDPYGINPSIHPSIPWQVAKRVRLPAGVSARAADRRDERSRCELCVCVRVRRTMRTNKQSLDRGRARGGISATYLFFFGRGGAGRKWDNKKVKIGKRGK